MSVHLVNPSDTSFGTAVITPRWLYVLAAATAKSFGDPEICDETLEHLNLERVQPGDVVGIESRGFLVAAPLAYELGRGFAMVRKKGKLPGRTARLTYDLEYGTDTIEIQEDAIIPGQRIVVLDDLLATGGTMQATIKLIRQRGGEVTAAACIIELAFLNGRDKLQPYQVFSLLQY